MQFCHFVASLYPHVFTNFDPFILIFSKMALIFSKSIYRFYRFKFRVSPCQIALTSSLMMSGLNSPTWIHWIIRFGGYAGVLSQAATEARTIPEYKNTLDLIWSAYRRKPFTTLWKTTASVWEIPRKFSLTQVRHRRIYSPKKFQGDYFF